ARRLRPRCPPLFPGRERCRWRYLARELEDALRSPRTHARRCPSRIAHRAGAPRRTTIDRRAPRSVIPSAPASAAKTPMGFAGLQTALGTQNGNAARIAAAAAPTTNPKKNRRAAARHPPLTRATKPATSAATGALAATRLANRSDG